MADQQDSTGLPLLKIVCDAFLIPYQDGRVNEIDAELQNLGGALGDIAKAFRRNLDAAEKVGGVPYKMAFDAACKQRTHSLFIAEKIRAGHDHSIKDEEQCWEAAQSKFRVEIEDPATKEHFINDILLRLRHALDDPDLIGAAAELLSESLVMEWGAFEVLVSDVVRYVLNNNPSLALRLVSTDPSKRHFKSNLSLESIAYFDFQLKNVMGDLLFADQFLDNLYRMRDVISVLFPRALAVHAALASDDLHHIWQTRHLIVHRRGIVDEKFAKNTRSKVSIGERLPISPQDIESAMRLIADAGAKLLAAARTESERNQ
jgi:hypothetical protein